MNRSSQVGLTLLVAIVIIVAAGVIGGLTAGTIGAELAMIATAVLLGITIILFSDRWMKA